LENWHHEVVWVLYGMGMVLYAVHIAC
jgi:hypothetical protein